MNYPCAVDLALRIGELIVCDELRTDAADVFLRDILIIANDADFFRIVMFLEVVQNGPLDFAIKGEVVRGFFSGGGSRNGAAFGEFLRISGKGLDKRPYILYNSLCDALHGNHPGNT